MRVIGSVEVALAAVEPIIETIHRWRRRQVFIDGIHAWLPVTVSSRLRVRYRSEDTHEEYPRQQTSRACHSVPAARCPGRVQFGYHKAVWMRGFIRPPYRDVNGKEIGCRS